MKYPLLIFLLFSGLLANAQSSYWEALNAPPGGMPTMLTQTVNGWVYASFYDHSVYCSQDFGANWQQIFWPSTNPDTGFQQITVGRAGTLFAERHPDNSYLTWNYFSNDNGASWQLLSADSSLVQSICQTSSGTWFGTRVPYQMPGNANPVLRSDDEGVTWTEITTVSPPNYVYKITCDPFDRLILEGGGVNISAFSSDAGLTWIATPGVAVYEDFILTFEHSMIRWNNSNATTVRFDGTQNEVIVIDSALAADHVAGTRIYLAPESHELFAAIFHNHLNTGPYYYSYYHSLDDGLTWSALPNVTSLDALPVFMRLGDQSIIDLRQDAIFRSWNEGQNWFFSSGGIHRGGIRNFYAETDSLWLAMTYAGLWKTTDAGAQWQLIRPVSKYWNSNFFNECVLLDDANRLIISADDSLYISQDFGENFVNISPAEPSGQYWRNIGSNPATGTLFLRNGQGTLRSGDGGNTWNQIMDSLWVTKVRRHPSGVLYAMMDSIEKVVISNGNIIPYYYDFLYRSTDDGLTWQRVLDERLDDFTINGLGDVFAVSYGNVFRSVDNGNTWITKTGAYVSTQILCNGSNQLISSYFPGNELNMSVNNGQSWQSAPKVAPLFTIDEYYNYPAPFSISPSGRLYAAAELSYGNIGYLYRTTNPTTTGAYLTGTVYKDADGDCSTQDVESPLAQWLVKADGNDAWWANTDSAGRFTMFLDTGAYFLSVKPTLEILWESCADSLPVHLSVLQDTTTRDLAVKAIADCPYMTVDIAAPWLEKCFESPVYIQFCNKGTESADSVWVDVTLDPYLTFTDTLHPIPHEWADSATIRFYMGAVAAGDCGWFSFLVYTDCDSTLLGQTLCVAAHVHPDSLCLMPDDWSGAEIQVVARCEQDTSLTFRVTNVGEAPSQPLHYFVIEDDVVMLQGNQSYAAGQTKDFSFPANGHFRRFESQQEPGHPFSMEVAAWTEGCGGFESLGFPAWYFLNNGIPSESVYCGEIVGAFDPNDKQGLPAGFSEEHLVAPNTDIDYMIRFQNTGTAPAHTVVIRDTLSALLDPGALRMGAASHPFTSELSGKGILTLTFENINLPDSNSNAAASHGFVRFRISQQPDLPDGAVIRNIASIYFDFNGAVRTNQTDHRIGRHFIQMVDTGEPSPRQVGLRVSPNPAGTAALLTIDGLPDGHYTFLLTDINGKTVVRIPFDGHELTFRREQLLPGMYLFQIPDEQGAIRGAGKIMLR